MPNANRCSFVPSFFGHLLSDIMMADVIVASSQERTSSRCGRLSKFESSIPRPSRGTVVGCVWRLLSKYQRQPILRVSDHDNLAVLAVGQLLRCLDSFPFQQLR